MKHTVKHNLTWKLRRK